MASDPSEVHDEIHHPAHPPLELKPNSVPPPDGLFAKFKQELPGWKGYIEWEKYPERKALAAEILKRYKFAGAPEFQFVPIPETNPRIEGVRWKQYYYALGELTKNMPDESWDFVRKEKSEDMIHVLGFPYNGEPPRVRRPLMLKFSFEARKY
jgi:sulfite oxidase